MPSALSVVRGNECKITVNEKNAAQFCGSDARSLAVEIIPVVLIPHISNTFGIAVTSVKLKNDLNQFQIGISLCLFLVNTVFG